MKLYRFVAWMWMTECDDSLQQLPFCIAIPKINLFIIWHEIANDTDEKDSLPTVVSHFRRFGISRETADVLLFLLKLKWTALLVPVLLFGTCALNSILIVRTKVVRNLPLLSELFINSEIYERVTKSSWRTSQSTETSDILHKRQISLPIVDDWLLHPLNLNDSDEIFISVCWSVDWIKRIRRS